MKNPIIELYNLYFPIEKVKADLFGYLDSMMADTFKGNEYVFEVPEIDSPNISKEVRINRNDLLTIYKIKSSYEFRVDFYYYIYVGIGKFRERDKNGFYEIEKCNALMKYNYDFSLYDIEFYYSSITEMD